MRDRLGRFTKGHSGYRKLGEYKPTLETREKVSLAMKNRVPKNIEILLETGKKTRFKKGDNAGEKHWDWQGGKGSERHRAMRRIEYILWRIAVFTRDNYTCQQCGEKGVYLEADHIKSWSLYPELRYAIDNGRTLCKSCHQQTETYPVSLRERSVV